MAEQEELQDSPTPEEESVTSSEAEEAEGETPPEDTVSRAEFDKVYARAKKAEDAMKEYREQLAVLKPKPKTETTIPQFDPEEIESRVDLRLRGYNKEEIDYANRYAKAAGQKLGEIINDPFVQGGIEKVRERAKVEQAKPAPSSRAAVQKEEVSFAKLPMNEQRRVWSEALAKRQRSGQTFE